MCGSVYIPYEKFILENCGTDQSLAGNAQINHIATRLPECMGENTKLASFLNSLKKHDPSVTDEDIAKFFLTCACTCYDPKRAFH